MLTSEKLIEAVHKKIYATIEAKQAELIEAEKIINLFKDAESESEMIKYMTTERKASRLKLEIEALKIEETEIRERAKDFTSFYYKAKNSEQIVAELKTIIEAINNAPEAIKEVIPLRVTLSDIENALKLYNGRLSDYEWMKSKEPLMAKAVEQEQKEARQGAI